MFSGWNMNECVIYHSTGMTLQSSNKVCPAVQFRLDSQCCSAPCWPYGIFHLLQPMCGRREKCSALWREKKENIWSNLENFHESSLLFRPDTHQMCRRTNLKQEEFCGKLNMQVTEHGNVYLTITFVRQQKNNPCCILMTYLHLSYHINMHRAKSKSDGKQKR